MTVVYANPSQAVARQVAQTVERLLQSARQASTAPSGDPAITQAADQAAARPTAEQMAAKLDSLINQWLPVKSPATAAPGAGANAGVVNAVVVSSTLIDQALTQTQQNTSLNSQQFTIRLNSNGRTLELTSQVAIPTGSQVKLQINSNNLATVLAISAAIPTPNTQARATSPATVVAPGLLNNSTNQALAGADPALSAATNQTAARADTNPAAARLATIEQALRLALPQQDAVKNLLPLLQNISQTISQNNDPGAQSPWPKPLQRQLDQLLSLFPKPQQLQTAASLKQVLTNSGLFLEPKLLQLANQQQLQAKIAAAQTTLNQGRTEPLPKQAPLNMQPLARDVKARIHLLLKEVQAQQQSSQTRPLSAAASGQSAATETTNPAVTASIPADKLALLATAAYATQTASGDSKQEQNADVLLRQLGKQLLATLAKTQINQMETLAARQQNTPDNQGPLNSWTTEIPIMHGKHVDNLELNIQQYEHGDTSKGKKKKLWTVMLAFDLHQLGKMNVQLKILDSSVAATVWSETARAHSEVKQHIQDLKKKLTSAGVNVKQVDCKLGLPSKKDLPVYNQLVDVVT